MATIITTRASETYRTFHGTVHLARRPDVTARFEWKPGDDPPAVVDLLTRALYSQAVVVLDGIVAGEYVVAARDASMIPDAWGYMRAEFRLEPPTGPEPHHNYD